MRRQKDIKTDFIKQVGQNVKRIRQEKGLSQEELGLEIGLTRMHIYRIEKGYNITLATLIKIATALGVQASDITKTPKG